MQNKGIIAAVIIFIIIIAGMFVYAYIKKNELQTVPEKITPAVQIPGPYDYITRVDAKHFFIKGTHTIVGEISMPTKCELLNWDTNISKTTPEKAMVNFDIINNSKDCAEAVTNQRFKVSFDAGENASITATIKGRPIELNLVPAASGETPENYELFIKG